MQDRATQSFLTSPYGLAIDLTSQTIARRTKYFRNLVVTVVSIGTVSLGWTVIAWTLVPLSGLLLLLPVCGIFFFLDARLLNHWRSRLAGAWAKGEIKLGHFVEAVSAIPVLPKATLHSMLATLPLEGKFMYEGQVSSKTRRAVAEVLLSLYGYRADVLAILATGYTIVAASVIVSVAVQAWQLLLTITLVLPLPLIRVLCKNWRFKSALRKTLVERRSVDFNHDRYLNIISCMDWHGIPNRDKARFLIVP